MLLGDDLVGSTVAGGVLVLIGLWLVQRQPAATRAEEARLQPAK